MKASQTSQYKNLSQYLREPQDLSDENSKTNVNAGNKAQESSQILRGDLTEVHRHHTERNPCRNEESAINTVWLCWCKNEQNTKYELKRQFKA